MPSFLAAIGNEAVSVNAEKVVVTCDSKSLNALMPMEMVNWMPQSERLPCEKCEIAAMVNEAYAKNKSSSGANQKPLQLLLRGLFSCSKKTKLQF